MLEAKNKVDQISFSAPINIRAAAPDASGKETNARFDIRAYNGDKMWVSNYPWAPVVIDLSGMIIASQQIPILDNHEPKNKCVLGQTDKVEIVNGGIDEAGNMYSLIDEQAKMICAKAAAGHQWKASVGVKPLSIEECAAGASVTVNGRTIQGPVDVLRTSALVETSIVVIGADNTSAVNISASAVKNNPKPVTIILI